MGLKNGFGKNIIFIRYFGYSITQGDFSGLRPGGRVVLNFPDRAGCGERAFHSSTCASGSTSCGAVLRSRSGSFTVVGLGVGHFRFQGCFLYRAAPVYHRWAEGAFSRILGPLGRCFRPGLRRGCGFPCQHCSSSDRVSDFPIEVHGFSSWFFLGAWPWGFRCWMCMTG